MAINLKNLNVNKADVGKTFTYEVKLTGDYEKFNGQITAECRHFTIEDYEKCATKDADGEKIFSTFAVFKLCCSAIHGLESDGVELTPSDLCKHCFDNAEVDGINVSGLFVAIIADIAKAVIKNHSLNEDERKN